MACNTNAETNPEFAWVNTDSIAAEVKFIEIEEGKPHTVNFAKAKKYEALDVALISDSIKAVKLSTDEDNIIGCVQKIIYNDERLFILDRKKSKGIFVFSKDGQFLNKIGTLGQGPGEYAEPTDFDVYDGKVYVLDQLQSRLNIYELDGEYVSSKRMPFIATALSIANDSTIYFNNIDADNQHLNDLINYSIYITDSNFKINGCALYREHGKYSSVLADNLLNRYSGAIYYHAPLTNTIYKIDGERIAPFYKIDFGKKSLPKDMLLNENWKNFTSESVQSSYYIFDSIFCVASNWLYFTYIDNHVKKHAFYDKNSNNIYSSPTVIDYKYNKTEIGNVLTATGNILISVNEIFSDDNPLIYFIYMKNSDLSQV
jgi:hypothetical protein